MNEETNIKSCCDCQYSKNGKTSCFRHMEYASPKIDLSKGAECVYNGYAHYLKFTSNKRS